MLREQEEVNREFLTIPRRPYWDLYTTAADLEKREKEEFLEWRRLLAVLQDEKDIKMTPFEKNLQFWRQLWRVVERSEIIVQILDARNPLLFYSEDLKKYAKEVSSEKVNVMLLNKSDYLTDEQREAWAKYFDSIETRAVFFSALEEIEGNESIKGGEGSAEDSDEDSNSEELQDQFEQVKVSSSSTTNSSKLLTSNELIDYFKSIECKKQLPKGHLTVGLVGYPNVGKSSTINAILKEKKVSVSATPGKTKHFQTILLDEELCLCDCPGLVFPNFVANKAEMIVNGILPIDQMTDHVPPVNLVTSYIPRHRFAEMYGIVLPKDTGTSLRSDELLNSYGFMRGFMTARGLPDNPRASRYILKDFVTGKLLYAIAPPGVEQEKYHFFPPPTSTGPKEMTRQQRRVMDTKDISDQDFDEAFFTMQNSKAHVKGVSSTSGYTRGIEGSILPPKGWKKHNNRNKKEKLRRVYAHLDG